jgi:hypothetical protein
MKFSLVPTLTTFQHGILGMTDLLKDSALDGQQVSHVATIETCGKTLLETINHVSWDTPYQVLPLIS